MNLLLSKLQDKHLKDLVRGAIGFFNIRIVGKLVSYIFTYLVIQWYGVEIFGIYSLSIVSLRVALIFGRVGLDNALVRFIAVYAAKDRRDLVKQVYLRAIRVAIPCSLVVSILLFAAAPILAQKIFQNPALVTSLRIIAIIILPGALLELNAASLRGLKRIKTYSFLLHVSQFLLGILILFLCKSFLEKNSAPAAAYAIATAAAVFISFGFGKILWRTGKKTKKTGESIETGTLMKVAFPMMLTGAYSFVLYWTDTIIIGICHSEAEVGIYNVVIKVAAFLTFTLTSINSIAASKFSECYATDNMDGFRKVTKHSTRLIFWTTFPLCLVFLAFPAQLLGLFGKDIRAGASALILVVLGYFTNAVSGPVGTILNMTGHQVVYQKIVLCAAGVNVLLNILLIPRFGINGAAFASMISMAIWNLSSVFYIKKKFDIMTLYLPFLNRIRGA